MTHPRAPRHASVLALILTALAISPRPAHAIGLNTDVALTPSLGGTIIRIQWRYSELSDDPTPADRDVKRSVVPITVVHGLSERLALITTTAFVHTDADPGPTATDSGTADATLLAKYRFFQDDQMGKTTRWAMLTGASIPSHDDPFSTESLDPIIGTVWTLQTQDYALDWDLIYRMGTGGGPDSDDQFKFDLAYSQTIHQAQSPTTGPWACYAIAEINAQYITDGSTQVFLSPGLQLVTRNLIFEAGIQLPILQDLTTPRLKTDYTTVLSVRLQF